MHAVSTNVAKPTPNVIMWRHKQRIFSYIDHHTPLHYSVLQFVRGAYNLAADPGITRSLYATDRTSLKKMSLKKFQAIWQPYLDQIFGQFYRIRIGPDCTMKILDWIRITKISNLFNTRVWSNIRNRLDGEKAENLI